MSLETDWYTFVRIRSDDHLLSGTRPLGSTGSVLVGSGPVSVGSGFTHFLGTVLVVSMDKVNISLYSLGSVLFCIVG